MDIINEKINIKNMYNYDMTELDKESYQKYIRYLTIYFAKEGKKDKYTKEYIDDTFILIDKSNPKKRIEIKPSQFIDLNELYFELQNYSKLILYKINNIIDTKNNITDKNRDEFNELKNKYLLCKEKIDDINVIKDEYYTLVDELYKKMIELSFLLAKYYQSRNESYDDIEENIKEELKNKLIRYFKENKKRIPPLNIINKIAKENNIKSVEIEKWFVWIENVYKYLDIQFQLNKIEKDINEKETQYMLTTKYMIIKKPEIKE